MAASRIGHGGHSAEDAIDLCDSDDEVSARPVKPLPQRGTKSRITIIDTDTEPEEIEAGPSRTTQHSQKTFISRKGKEVDRLGGTPQIERMDKETGSLASRNGVSLQTTGNSESLGPMIRFPLHSTADGLKRTLNKTRKGSNYEYVIFAPPSGKSTDRTFKCSYPQCAFRIGFRETRTGIWNAIPDMKESRHNHRPNLAPPVATSHPMPSTSSTPRTSAPTDPQRSVREVLMGSQRHLTDNRRQRELTSVSKSPDKPKRSGTIAPASTLSGMSRHKTSIPYSRAQIVSGPSSSKSHVTPSPSKLDRVVAATTGTQSSSRVRASMSKTPGRSGRESDGQTSTNGDLLHNIPRGTPAYAFLTRSRVETPGSDARFGQKRTFAGAFGSHAKVSRTPGELPIGRDLRNKCLESLDSPSEVSSLLDLDAIANSPTPWNPKASKMDRYQGRSDTSTVGTLRGTPTPSENPARRTINEAAYARLMRPSPGPSLRAGTAVRATSPLKRSLEDDISEPISSTSARRHSNAAGASTLNIENTQSQPVRSSSRASVLQHDSEASQPEASGSTRPKRSRPAAGTYTIPSIDAEEWPSAPTQSGTPTKLDKGKSRISASGSRISLQPPTPPAKASGRLTPAHTSSKKLMAYNSISSIGSVTPVKAASTRPATPASQRVQAMAASGSISSARRHEGSNTSHSGKGTSSKTPRLHEPTSSPEEPDEPLENLPPSLPASQQTRAEGEDDLVCLFRVRIILRLMMYSWLSLETSTLIRSVRNKA